MLKNTCNRRDLMSGFKLIVLLLVAALLLMAGVGFFGGPGRCGGGEREKNEKVPGPKKNKNPIFRAIYQKKK